MQQKKPIRCFCGLWNYTGEKKTKLERREKPHGAIFFPTEDDSMHQNWLVNQDKIT